MTRLIRVKTPPGRHRTTFHPRGLPRTIAISRFRRMLARSSVGGPRRRHRRRALRNCARSLRKRVMDGMQRSQGPLMARSSRPRRRMEIIDESQSACLPATNTYLSEAPCNHNKTAAANERERESERERERERERAQFLTSNLFRFNCHVLRVAIAGKSSPGL